MSKLRFQQFSLVSKVIPNTLVFTALLYYNIIYYIIMMFINEIILFSVDDIRGCPEDLLYCGKEEDFSAATYPMKPVIQLLQKELGDTAPPITDCFFVWLCFFFPDDNSLLEE